MAFHHPFGFGFGHHAFGAPFGGFGSAAPTFGGVYGGFGAAPFGASPFGAAATRAPGSPGVGADGLVPHQEGEDHAPTLTYFGTYGLAQAIRLVFVEAGVHFHEREIETKEDWQNLKNQLPWGQLPVLEIDGQVISQSTAIVKFLGRKYNLAGGSPQEQAEVDSVIEAVKDVSAAFPLYRALRALGADDGSLEKAVAAVADDVAGLRKQLEKFEHFLSAKFGGQAPPEGQPVFFVGNSLTIADLVVYASFHMLAEFAGEHGAFEDLPLLQRALDTTYSRRNIQAFLDGPRAFAPVPSPEKMKAVFSILS